ncbi:hypothetical protein OG230_15045 [Streptomyces sp. NBC_00234]|uniref:hypothetical protein n=1 Tax=Streptomyces sp. NBC_00234 TaxID=2903638 RepID=UPI002E2C13EC|nr:hypothetical protein [Streptomyces sp. NBC_00234]
MRPYQRILGTVGTAAALTVMMGTNAWAEQDCYISAKNYYASMVSFTAYGEKVNIIDQEADGHSAVAIFDTNGGTPRTYTLWNSKGKGTNTLYDFDLAEGTPVVIQACVGEYGTKTVDWDSCGPYAFGEA